MVVDVFEVVLGGICLQHVVEGDDVVRAVSQLFAPAETGGWNDGADYGLYLVQFGDFAHGNDVAIGVFNGDRSVVLGKVVGAGEDEDIFRVEGKHILAETHQHLAAGLSGYAAADEIVVCEERRVVIGPGVGD